MTMTWPKAFFFALVSFIAVNVFSNALAARVFPEDDIVFLQENDAVPRGAVLIRELNLSATSYADSCAWFELLLKGARIASGSGGNLVKIIGRADRQTDGCDFLSLGIYRVDSPYNADRVFRWTRDRKLRWEDFQGLRRSNCGERVAAETSCGISVETSLAPATSKARIYVFNSFDKQQSWVRRDGQCDAVLRHEQGHWDLCEIYTRRMQDRFDALNIRGGRLNEMVSRIFDQVESEYLKRQEAYESETRHGVDKDAQRRWEFIIGQELASR